MGGYLPAQMKIFYWKSEESNFGDDLNAWFWPEMLGDAISTDDNVLFAGIGSVLGADLPVADRTVVLGAGAGYSPLPSGFGGPSWTIYGVRGPLTAAFCGLDENKVLAVPAILIPRLMPPRAARDGRVCFVPHYHSAMRAPWDRICAAAGVALLDPRQSSKAVVAKIASSKLVLAESLHAAIVADAYRVPWIPVWSSREISSFKWYDWGMAVGAPINPQRLPAPSSLSWLDDFMAPFVANDNSRFPDPRAVDPSGGLPGAVERMRADLHARQGPWPQFCRRNYLRARDRAAVPFLRLIGDAWDERRIDRTAGTLAGLAKAKGFLSDEVQFRQAEARLNAAIERFKADRKEEFGGEPPARSALH